MSLFTINLPERFLQWLPNPFGITLKTDPATAQSLAEILSKIDQILMTQQELADKLTALGANVDKIGTETTASLALIEELKIALTDAGNTSPAVDAAVTALEARLKTVDDLVPDAAPPLPAE